MKPRARKTVDLSDSVHQRLNMYTLAAGAAGVGMLTMTQPSDAKIIYFATHKQISANSSLPLDLNHDGKVDFRFVDSQWSTSLGGGVGILRIVPHRSANEIWGPITSHALSRYASDLAAGVSVGAKGKFNLGKKIMALSASDPGVRKPGSTFCYGYWKHATNRYLGLRFLIDGKTHYGWARLNVSCSNLRVRATLTGYAYETIPDKSIITGKTKGPDVVTIQPATLGHLAAGASAIPVWRVKQTAATTH
jgi:hypothetical protein